MSANSAPFPEPPQAATLELLDLSLATPGENLALDEALLDEAEQTARRGETAREWLRFWESAIPFAILGSTGRLVEEVHVEACRREGIPILRRSSGGGTVLAGPGCLGYSLVLDLESRAEMRDIHASYRAILTRIAGCLGVEGLEHRGISDLALGDRKVSGNAQRRKSRTLLHHGTLLYDFDLKILETFLKNPLRQPGYRVGRSHEAFTANLPLSTALIKSRLAGCWNARLPGRPAKPPDVGQLVREKYGNPSWTQRF